jgi:hypothetical protein
MEKTLLPEVLSAPMRTLFLDFDGPLHPTSAIAGLLPRRGLLSSPEVKQRELFRWVPMLEQALADHEDVVIVVHSAWATHASNEELRAALGPLTGRYVGITPRDRDRWPGIQDTVERFGITSYRIIDDAVESFPADLAQLIAVDPMLGLSDPRPRQLLAQWLAEPLNCDPRERTGPGGN